MLSSALMPKFYQVQYYKLLFSNLKQKNSWQLVSPILIIRYFYLIRSILWPHHQKCEKNLNSCSVKNMITNSLNTFENFLIKKRLIMTLHVLYYRNVTFFCDNVKCP